jgi:tyrosinase
MANGSVVRPSAEHANVAALADAYQAMQALSASDNRSWIYWAEFHGFNRYECWHQARIGLPSGPQFPYDLFLPWHRAYLSFFDNVARDHEADAILPWWDWTSADSHADGLPAAYTGGGPALQSGTLPAMSGQPDRRTTRSPDPPDQLPDAARIDEILDLTQFRDFSNQLQDVHDDVHGWVGGDMGSIGTAAFDPVFWAHHAMIDRIWYLWQLRHGVNNIPPEYLDLALFPGLTVQQVLDVHALGYDYATGAVAAGGEDVPAGVGGADAPGVPDEGDGRNGDGGNSDERVPQTEGEKYESPPLKVAALDADLSRADIEFHEVDHAGASYEGRVYLNTPDADADTPTTSEAGYAGSYHVFGHGGCLGDPGHCEVRPRRPYDPRPAHPLTKAKKVVIATNAVKRAIQAGDNTTVTVVPIVEPLPYEDVESRYLEKPVEIGYVRIVTYR